MKTILLGDSFTFGGKSPFLVNRLIVEIEIPSNFETSLMVKKGRFSALFMVGIWWEHS